MKTKLFIAGLAVAVLSAPISSQAFEWKISGQVNSGVVFGGDTDDTTVVDNNASGSRFRFKGSQELDNGMKVGFRYELQDQDALSDSATLSDRADTEVRYSDVWVSGNWGKLGIGKGDGAANDTFEAYGLLCYLCGAENVYLYQGALAQAGNPVGYNTIDGTSRENRIRYDSPNFNGFKFAASLDNGDREELAVFYSGKVAGGTLNFSLGDVSEEDITSGSFAYKHDSGFGVAYSKGERGDQESDWVMLSYAFGRSDVHIGRGEFTHQDASGFDNDDEATIVTYRFKPVKGMEILVQYLDFENDSFWSSTDLGEGLTLFHNNAATSGDAFSIGSRIKF